MVAVRPAVALTGPDSRIVQIDPDDPFADVQVASAPRSVVAVGGTLDVVTLTSAYRHGCFPWPASTDPEEPGGTPVPENQSLDRQLRRLVRTGQLPVLPGPDHAVPWCSPQPRAVLLPHEVVVRRSLRQRLRHSGWQASLDEAFEDVVAACADRGEGTWITARMRQGYAELHRAGLAHSVEVWDGPLLVGGLYGVLVGGVFCGESMFTHSRDASKVALVELCARLLEAGGRLVDVQEQTEHLASLGQVLMHRSDYLRALAVLRDRPVELATERRPVARLAPVAG